MNKKLTEQDYINASKRLNCDLAAIKAVIEVESAGSGFTPNSRPTTLFEGHIFSKYTKGKYDNYSNISYKNWDKTKYGKNYIEEQARLDQAIIFDRQAALMSTSWGMAQVMGFNFALCGYKNVEDFVKDMNTSEATQLNAFCGYIEHNTLVDELQKLDWHTFARAYNGPAYQKNKYAEKLEQAYKKYK